MFGVLSRNEVGGGGFPGVVDVGRVMEKVAIAWLALRRPHSFADAPLHRSQHLRILLFPILLKFFSLFLFVGNSKCPNLKKY